MEGASEAAASGVRLQPGGATLGSTWVASVATGSTGGASGPLGATTCAWPSSSCTLSPLGDPSRWLPRPRVLAIRLKTFLAPRRRPKRPLAPSCCSGIRMVMGI